MGWKIEFDYLYRFYPLLCQKKRLPEHTLLTRFFKVMDIRWTSKQRVVCLLGCFIFFLGLVSVEHEKGQKMTKGSGPLA